MVIHLADVDAKSLLATLTSAGSQLLVIKCVITVAKSPSQPR